MKIWKRALAVLLVLAGLGTANSLADITPGFIAGLVIAAAGLGWLVLGRR